MVLREGVVAEATGAVLQERQQHHAVRVREDGLLRQPAPRFLSLRLARGFVPHLMLLAGAWLLASPASVSAQQPEAAGRFLSASGDVRIVGQNGATRPAQRSGEIRQGESIVTGSNGLGQVRMADGTLMSVRADTEMKIENFAYSGQ